MGVAWQQEGLIHWQQSIQFERFVVGKDKEGVFRLMEGDCSNKWLVLVLKDKFSNDSERENLKNCLMLNFPLKSTDIYYVKSEDCLAYSNFLFVREYGSEDLRSILEFKMDAFEP